MLLFNESIEEENEGIYSNRKGAAGNFQAVYVSLTSRFYSANLNLRAAVAQVDRAEVS
jgi:hypothetical protein